MLATNPIWRIPAEETLFESSIGILRQWNEVPIERQLHTFLKKQIEKWRPDIIIVVERKGTAILRALKEWDEDPLAWPWNDVVSSSAINQVSDDYFYGQKILVFDDMMKTGWHLKKLLKKLCDREIWKPEEKNLRTAVFALHEEASIGKKVKGKTIPDSWFYRNLDSLAYEKIRSDIIEMLQKKGSLMLDTEHIEVRLRLEGSLNSLVNALSRKADAVLFHSSLDRINITVFYKDDDAHTLPEKLFPKDTGLKKIVKKCRVIQRDSDEFAIIPICYPSIQVHISKWPTYKNNVDLLGNVYHEANTSCFYDVGLIAALEVLRWVFKDLAASGIPASIISLPKSPQDNNSVDGYDLSHINVMYPRLNVNMLTQRIIMIQKEAWSEGTLLKRIKSESRKSHFYTDDQLQTDARDLLQLIRDDLDQRALESYWIKDKITPHPYGLRAKEIFSLGRDYLGLEDVRISALFDILIDGAYLVPHVQKITNEEGIYNKIGRTFEPDGEVVSEWIRSFTDQYGLPKRLRPLGELV